MRLLIATVLGIAFASSTALAQSGHFITGGNNAPMCTVTEEFTVLCDGKVAGLGGTTFEIVVEAEGVAEVQCRNPGGNVAPGQDTEVEVGGTSGPLATPRNGQFNFVVETDEPSVPNTPTCPNPQWTAEVIDVEFGPATISLFEDNVLVDRIEVMVE